MSLRFCWIWGLCICLFLSSACSDELVGTLPGTGENNTDMEPEPAPDPEPEARTDFCSLQFPAGLCTRGDVCLDGSCVSLGLVCSPAQPEGLCQHGAKCLDGRCWGAEEVCSALKPIGVCPTGQFCDEGVCTTGEPCGAGEPAGSCEDAAQVCDGGECRPRGEVCGLESPAGQCPEARVCLHGVCVPEDFLCSPELGSGRCPAGETCSGGECVQIGLACSLANPAGACGGDFLCLEGACRNPEDLCSQSNPHGFCAMGLSCVGGQCVEQTLTCSPESFDGLCPPGMVCSAGHCHGPVACDDVFVFGTCPGQETCLCNVVSETALSSCSADYAPEDASDDQRLAIERANHWRNSIGLWSITEHPQINAAAQAHADYIVNEANEGHEEHQPGSPFFTGERFWERMEAAGYTGAAFSEVIAYTSNPVHAVDGLIATVYHREPFFSPSALELGYGGATGGNGAASVINFGAAARHCQDETLVVFPPHGAVDVPTSWDGAETPTPPAPDGGYPSGPIISVHGSAELSIDEHKIVLGGQEVDHVHLTSENDPNGAVGAAHYFLYTHKPLRPGTEYDVIVSGFHGPDPFYLRWSFTTGD